MLPSSKIIKSVTIAAVLAVGAAPSCTTGDVPLRPEDSIYTNYQPSPGPGPGIGCNRNPPPSQC